MDEDGNLLGEEKLRCEPLRLTALSGHTHPAASNTVIEGS